MHNRFEQTVAALSIAAVITFGLYQYLGQPLKKKSVPRVPQWDVLFETCSDNPRELEFENSYYCGIHSVGGLLME